MRLLALIVAIFLINYSARAETASAQFQKLIDDHWAWVLEQNPTLATSLGVRDYDDRLGRLSVSNMDATAARLKAFQLWLKDIDAGALSSSERLNHRLFALDLANDIEALSFGQRMILFTTYSSWHMNFAGLPDDLPFFTAADYESYIARLRDYPRLNAEGIATSRRAIAEGYTQPCVAIEGFENSISAHIVNDIEDSVLLKPFTRRPQNISEGEFANLRQQAAVAIKNHVIPAYRAFHKFFIDEYKPNCRQTPGISTTPNGAGYYAYRIKRMTTTDMTADEIHEIGKKEVARILAEMKNIIEQTGFKGDFKAFQTFLREDSQFYATSPQQLMEKASHIAKKIDGEMPKLFGRLPSMPYTLKPVPDDIAEQTTTAYYERPSGDGTRAGVYRVNTSKLNTRPLFELEALTLHEAVPGHHHQIALQQELDLPMFRRFGGITAFVEGWALYAEQLGREVGFYQDPYTNFGRLSYEMWRACRLVVDTGIHAKGWSKQQAIDFMAAHTALSLHNIEAEVNRYITWPGQALAYKIGQMKISALRREAEAALGEKFDLRAFHDRVLENGAVPLNVLEALLRDWMTAQLDR